MASICAMELLTPVISLIKTFQSVGQLNHQFIEILLKCTGIGIVAEIAGLICQDSGNATLSKALHICATVIVLRLSVPLFQNLLELLLELMEKL